METNNEELIQELKSYLTMKRQCLTDDEIDLINRVIEELEMVDKSCSDPTDCIFRIIRISELVLKLFDFS
jgi:hypothetical protein